MKPRTIFAFLLVAIAISAQAQTKVVELPHAVFANSRTLEISKVTLSDTETVLDVEAFFTPGYWIRVASDTYLLADGKKYMIRSGEGIVLDSLFWMPKSGKASFKLTFEPLPYNTRTFDFIESDCDDCFKIYGIDLVNKSVQLPPIPVEFTQKHPAESNFKTRLQKGKARVSGKIMGFVPTQEKYMLFYLNPITGAETNEPITINADGSFSASVTVFSPTKILLTDHKLLNYPVRVAPNQESKVWINFPEIYRSGSRLLKNEPSYGEKAYFSGYFASLNTDLNLSTFSGIAPFDLTDSIAGMDANAYKAFMVKLFNNLVASIDTFKIQPLAKKLIKAEYSFGLYNYMESMDYYLMQAYMKKHGLSREETMKVFTPPTKPADFSDYYRLIPYDDPDVMLVSDIGHRAESLGYSRENSSDPYEVLRYLAAHEKVSTEDRDFFKAFVSAHEKREEFKGAGDINNIFGKYKDISGAYLKDRTGAGLLASIWNSSDAFLLNLIKSMKISLELQNFNPFTDTQKAEIGMLPPIIREALLEENEKLLAKIEENKKKTGFTVLNPPTNVDEQLFVDLLKPFAGKVILVDVWATWCGPCRIANKEMEPLKAQFADKDVVFLYLAGENSPENTWKNMITDIKGQHYRVNKAQWDYLLDSLNASGVPTYIIIDRQGNHSYHSVGFPGVDTMRRELSKAL